MHKSEAYSILADEAAQASGRAHAMVKFSGRRNCDCLPLVSRFAYEHYSTVRTSKIARLNDFFVRCFGENAS